MILNKAIYTGDKAGLNGKPISLTFEDDNVDLSVNDCITYDPRDGVVLMIIEILKNTYKVVVVTHSPEYNYFPSHKLEKGVGFYKLSMEAFEFK